MKPIVCAISMLLALTACAAPSVLQNGLIVTGQFAVVTGTNNATINGARIATTNDLRAGTVTNVTLGTNSYTDAVTLLPGAAMEFVNSPSGLILNATALAPDLSALSNGLGAVGLVASNAVPLTGATMTGVLNAPKVRGTNVLFTNWRTTMGTYDGRHVHGFSTVADGGQVGMSLIGDPGSSEEGIEIGPYYSVGTRFGGGFLRFVGNDPVGLGRAMSFGMTPSYGTGSEQTTALIRVYSSSDSALWARRFEGNAAGLTNMSASTLTGTLPAGVLGTNIPRTVGSLSTTGTVDAGRFVGDGSMLSNVTASTSVSAVFWSTNSVMTNALVFSVPSNSTYHSIRIYGEFIQTATANNAQSIYMAPNGITGTNALYGYQLCYYNHLTAAGASSSNNPEGAFCGTFRSDPAQSNSAATVEVKWTRIYGPPTEWLNIGKRWSARSFYRLRTASGSGNQQITDIEGLASFGAPITQIQIWASAPWSNSNWSAEWVEYQAK